MNPNLHYGKLAEPTAAKLNAKMPGTLIAGRFRTTEATELSLNVMRGLAKDSNEIQVDRCFACAKHEISCPENKRVVCMCGRTYFKYFDITEYSTFVERSRWNLFWNRLNFKTLFTLRKPK